MKLVIVMNTNGYSVYLKDGEKKKALLEGINNAFDVLMFCAGFQENSPDTDIEISSYCDRDMYFELGKHAAKQHNQKGRAQPLFLFSLNMLQ